MTGAGTEGAELPALTDDRIAEIWNASTGGLTVPPDVDAFAFAVWGAALESREHLLQAGAEQEHRYATMIGEISDALGLTETDQFEADGADKILARIAVLHAPAATAELAPERWVPIRDALVEYGRHFAETLLHQSASKADISHASTISAMQKVRRAIEGAYESSAQANPAGWQPMHSAPKDRRFLAVVDGDIRIVSYGKTSHVPMWGWCLVDQGAEDADLCQPTAWMPLPTASQGTAS